MPKKKPFSGPCVAHGSNHEPIVCFTDLRGRGGSFRPANDFHGCQPEYSEIPPDWDWPKYSWWLKHEVGKLVKPGEMKFVESKPPTQVFFDYPTFSPQQSAITLTADDINGLFSFIRNTARNHDVKED